MVHCPVADFSLLTKDSQLLPEVVAAESPHVAYHPGSPWGDGLKTSNKTVGDMHQWNGEETP